MGKKNIIPFATLLMVLSSFMSGGVARADKRYVGGDISLLPEYEKAGAQYYDSEGRHIENLLPFLHEQGMNAMRVRLFVDPSAFNHPGADPNACQDLGYILPLCRRIKEAGFALMLDFHYSDTWADPSAQWTPASWAGQTDSQLEATIGDYTRSVLTTLSDQGCAPDFIQPGNEISFGMLWGPYGTPSADLKKPVMGDDAHWERFGRLLRSAIGACREVCPSAGIILHTERIDQKEVLVDFYRRMARMEVDYDIIGLSYYPYFHGDMRTLDNVLSTLTSTFPSRRVMIVETGFPYAWEVPGTTHTPDYEYSEAGQNDFARDLVATLEKYPNVCGLFWWWLEYNAKGTALEGWYNAPLFDSRTGKATAALRTICSFTKEGDGVGNVFEDEARSLEIWYDLQGRRVAAPRHPGLYIRQGETHAIMRSNNSR